MGDGRSLESVDGAIVESMCGYLEASRVTTSEDRRWSDYRGRTMTP